MTKPEQFGRRLIRLRGNRSIREIAQGADLSITFVRDLETGARTCMTIGSATRLAKSLGVSLKTLDAPVVVLMRTGIHDVTGLESPANRFHRTHT